MSTTAAPTERTTRFPDAGRRRIAITGGTGLLGSALVQFLAGAGHEPVVLTRRPRPGQGVAEVGWDPERGVLAAADLAGVDAVVHLAGAPVSERWTPEHKREILESRVKGTRLVAETLARMGAAGTAPRVLVSASAVGYYGDGGDTLLTEDSPPGRDFLAGVARDWEAATGPAADAGVRVAIARLGLVLSPDGGALAKLLTPFRMGAGGRIGDGRQWQSWISLDDTVGALEHLAFTDGARGPFNVVGPNPVRNAELARVLGHVLNRPALVPVPAFALKLAFGEMAEAVLLAGQRASCERLVASGYQFRHATLEEALRFELSRE